MSNMGLRLMTGRYKILEKLIAVHNSVCRESSQQLSEIWMIGSVLGMTLQPYWYVLHHVACMAFIGPPIPLYHAVIRGPPFKF